MTDHTALIAELLEHAEWEDQRLNQACADVLRSAAEEIGRLRAIVRVNALRHGASDADISAVLEQKPPPGEPSGGV